MDILKSFKKLQEYCEKENFRGWDPFDGLNSRFFCALRLNHIPLVRMACIQFFKRFPVNLRTIFQVPKEYNPKALGLFLAGYCNLYKIEKQADYLNKIKFFYGLILKYRSVNWSGSCWGYNFDWQTRAFFQPKYTPTVVASSFIANALLDAYEILKDQSLLNNVRSTCKFILNDLNRSYDKEGNFAFSYSPLDNSQIFNASFLASRLLGRTYHYTKEIYLMTEAKKSIEFCCKYQNTDGSWPYGTLKHHRWIDNFHTGYNIECLYEYQKYTQDESYTISISNSLHYYLNTFFDSKGRAKYFNNSLYPIDIHAAAQFIVTLFRVDGFEEYNTLASAVLKFTIKNMQDQAGYFYYQIGRSYINKIPYMRWSQAWMFYALSCYLVYNNY